MKRFLNRFFCILMASFLILGNAKLCISAVSTELKESTAEEVHAADIVEPVIISEDETKRTENEKHFLCDDGSYIAIKYPFAVHSFQNNKWVDAEYELLTTNTHITPLKDNGWASLAVNPTSDDDIVTVNTAGYNVSWKVIVHKKANLNKLSATQASIAPNTELSVKDNTFASVISSAQITKQNSEAILRESENTLTEIIAQKTAVKNSITSQTYDLQSLENNSDIKRVNEAIKNYNREKILDVASAQAMVEYPNAFSNGISLRYIYSPNRINEEIILSSLNDFEAYSMVMDTCGLEAVIDPQNRISLNDSEGKTIITIAAPYMYDDDDAISTNIEVSMVQKGNTCVIVYTPDKAWLESAERSWPVVIDPGISNTLNTPQIDQLDNYVYAGQYYAVDDCSPTLKVGYEGGAEHWTYWGIQDWFPTVNSSSNIKKCTFNIRFQGGTTTMGPIGLYVVNSVLNTYTLTWSNKPALGNLLGTQSTVPDDLWLSFSGTELKSYVKQNFDVSIPEETFALKYTTYYNDYNWFFSSDYRPNGSLAYIPYLEVSYDYNLQEKNGRFYLKNASMGSYLSVLNNSSVNGAQVVQNNVSNNNFLDSQTWEIVCNSDGSHKISPMSATNLALHWNGSGLVLSNNLSSANSKWLIDKNASGHYRILLYSNPTLLLTATSSSNNSPLSLSTNTGNSNQRWNLEQKYLPTSGSEIPYNVTPWTGDPGQTCNCYSYSINNQKKPNGDILSYQNPGIYAGYDELSTLKNRRNILANQPNRVVELMELDFIARFNINENNVSEVFRPIGQYEQCEPGMYKIAFVYSNDDFHYYRQNPDGTWSHKRGGHPVKNYDESDNIIIDPQNCDRGPYIHWYGYYAVKNWDGLYS